MTSHGSGVVVIDSGSFETRVGFSTDSRPVRFRSLVARGRLVDRKDTSKTVVLGLEDTFSQSDFGRGLVRGATERGVVVNYGIQETILDHAFESLALGESVTKTPVLITEPHCVPREARGSISELLFECYNIPAVCYGVDSLFASSQTGDERVSKAVGLSQDALIVSVGHASCEVIPVLNGKARHADSIRLPRGTQQVACQPFGPLDSAGLH